MALHEVPLVAFAADLLCPERCAACATFVHPRELFCSACRARVRQLGPPECPGCGCPRPASERCEACTRPDAPIRTARAWASYHHPGGTSPVAQAIASFKYGGARRLGRRLATAMLPRVPTPDVALVAPIPLHPRRLRQRGFNQSAVLARHVARSLGVPVALTLIGRMRDTPSQVALNPQARDTNVAGAFAVCRRDLVRDRAVLVIDDVWTSGATARAVATALRMAGAVAVDVLTVARVL